MRLFFKRATIDGVHFVEYILENSGYLHLPFDYLMGTHILREGTDDAAVNYARLHGWMGARALAHDSEIGQMILKGRWVEKSAGVDEEA